MESICAYLRHDHQRCDELFDRAETSVAQRKWEAAIDHFRRFQEMLRRHVRMEESVLLPAFEQALSGGAGPAAILRAEHRQIDGIVDRMREAIERSDPAAYVLHAETLTLLMQQHALKEEDMLYPLLDRVLACKRDKLISAMMQYIDPHAPQLAAR